MRTLIETDLPLNLYSRGKVRDLYQLAGNLLLLIATDRISAFDVVLPTPIPDKGKVLTQMSRFWFERTTSWLPNHLLSTEWHAIAAALRDSGVQEPDYYRESIEGRSMLVYKAQPFPVECVVRGYLAGSLWQEYCLAGGPEQEVELQGIVLPAGLRESERLPTPIFTPATKVTEGHDQNISFEQMVDLVGAEKAQTLRQLSLRLYQEAVEYALERGILIADTKFEFGERDGTIQLIDEVLTPDSSRFWDLALYTPGKPQPSFDKQFVRDYLHSLGWDKKPPAPELPPEVVRQTAEKYREAYRRITGKSLD